MEDWKEYTVQELIDLDMLEEPLDGNHGEKHPKSTDYVESGVPFVMANNLKGGSVDLTNCYFITEEQANSLDKGFAKPGDVLLTHKATLGRTAIVPDLYPIIVLTPQVTYYRCKKGINNIYLKYYFDSPNFQKLFENWAGSGSTRLYLGIKAQRRLPIKLPPLPTQQKIAAVLSALDDKIELNRQINANLEQQAQAIFKNWFVDFEPFGGQMPSGWRVGKLSEILAEIETGKRENGGALSCGIPSIGAEKIENITYYDFSAEKYISQDLYQKMTKGKIKSGDVLLYKDGAYTGKSTMFLNDFPYKECAVNEHVFLLRTAESKYQCFLYLLISQKDTKTYLHTMASSKAAQPGLNKTELQSLDIIIPTNDVLDKFEEIIRPLFTLIIHGLEQSRTLASIRDTLLPKLMSGELQVD